MRLIYRFLQYINLVVSIYIWKVYIAKDVDDQEFIPSFKRSVAFVFANLLVTYPLNYLHFNSWSKERIAFAVIVLVVQSYLTYAYCFSLSFVTISQATITTFSTLFSITLSLAGLFPISSDMIMIINQFFAAFLFTYASTKEIFIAYFIPIWSVGEAVVMCYGISQLKKYKKYSTNSVQCVLGLNDSQLLYFILYVFAFLMNLCDYFYGVKHLLPLLTFIFALPGIYAQLDHKYKAANVMSLLYFLLYFFIYNKVKITLAS